MRVNQLTREVEYVATEDLAHRLTVMLDNSKDIDFPPSQIQSMVRWWISTNCAEAGLKHLPPAVLEKSKKGLTFRRLPFDYKKSEELPHPRYFTEFCSRCTDPDVLKAFIGSLFVDNSYNQQYLFLFGLGNDGKGTFFNFLRFLLGQTYIADDVASVDSPFWSSNLLGKRLCVFPELSDVAFPTSPRFRSLTGDDLIKVEEKYKAPTFANINTKFIFASNDNLELTGRKADRRRALYVAIQSFRGETDPLFLEKLCDEAPSIYAVCLEKYKEFCPNNGPIPQEASQKEITEFDYDNTVTDFFDTYFRFGPGCTLTGVEWRNAKEDFFKHRPTRKEEQMCNTELANRGLRKKRNAKGWVIEGMRKNEDYDIDRLKSKKTPKRIPWSPGDSELHSSN